MATIGVLTLELRIDRRPLAQGQAARGAEPEGEAAAQVQRRGGRDRLPGPLAAGGGGRRDGLQRPRSAPNRCCRRWNARPRSLLGPLTGRTRPSSGWIKSGMDPHRAGAQFREALREELGRIDRLRTDGSAPGSASHVWTTCRSRPTCKHALVHGDGAERRSQEQKAALAALDGRRELPAAAIGGPAAAYRVPDLHFEVNRIPGRRPGSTDCSSGSAKAAPQI